MGSLEALQDKFQRPLVFEMRIRVSAGCDPKGALLAALRETDVRITDIHMDEIDEETGDLLYDMMLFVKNDEQVASAVAAANGIEGVSVEEVLDLAMESHRGGACEMMAEPIDSNTALRIIYTPGVARVCKAIEAEPELAWDFTAIHNTVAIVTNGTAILGLGDIGAVPGMPVMEGKSAIFRNFANISAMPILVDTKDPDKFIETVCTIAPTFGAIQVEDVKAPECFRITRELDERLDIPVMHDDQYGTATIVLASLNGALKNLGRKIGDIGCVISGAGASGTAISHLLQEAGIADVVLVDSRGIVHKDRGDLNEEKKKLAERTNAGGRTGTLADAMAGMDLFIGCSMPNIVSGEMVGSMSKDPIVFALANPISEISREDALGAGAAIYADGRMVNNAIAYPGIFRGALDARSKVINIEMMMAAAEALASIVPDGKLLPEMMDPATHAAVAEAVFNAAPTA